MPDNTFCLIDANRTFLQSVLQADPAIAELVKLTRPCLGDSTIHCGETALILFCPNIETLESLAKCAKTLVSRTKSILPFAEIRLEIDPEPSA